MQIKSLNSKKTIAKKKSINYFLRQWFKSKRRNKKATMLFGIFLTIAICICALADKPQNKRDSNIEYLYKVNMCRLNTHEKSWDLYKELSENEDIREIVINYGRSVPATVAPTENSLGYADYELVVHELPADKEVFKLSDKIKYGTYYTDVNQVILSYNLAMNLSPDNPEKLIGQTMTKKLYLFGNVDFEIVGIFDQLDKIEQKYFDAMELYGEYDWYVNADFTKQYAYKEEFIKNQEQRGYTLYFDSYRDMKSFYDENYERLNARNAHLMLGLQSGKMMGLFDVMYKLFLPLSAFVGFFTILFYVNLIKTELTYNNKFISVFEYAGYSKNKVINKFIWLNVLYLLKICTISAALAFLITYVVNIVNQKLLIVEFQIFTYNFKILGAFMVCMILISIIVMNIILRRVKVSSWYENIVTQRDLI